MHKPADTRWFQFTEVIVDQALSGPQVDAQQVITEDFAVAGSGLLSTLEQTVGLLFEDLIPARRESFELIMTVRSGRGPRDHSSRNISQFNRNSLKRPFAWVVCAVAVVIDMNEATDTGRF